MLPALQKFKSTCAPDGPLIRQPVMPPAEVVLLSVADLKSKLKSLGEPIKGKKDELQARLAEAVAREASKEEATVNVPQNDAVLSAVEGGAALRICLLCISKKKICFLAGEQASLLTAV